MDPASTIFVLGYHGCDAAVAERVFSGKTSLTASENDYDWLGHGVYFWEHNAQRAFEFARELRNRPRRGRPRVKRPAVVGAIIDLGICLNLLDSRFIDLVRQAYGDLAILHETAGEALPSNAGGQDRLLRRLDCAVIEMLHRTRLEREELAFDTVRAAFVEGSPIYQDAGFHAKNHILLNVAKQGAYVNHFDRKFSDFHFKCDYKFDKGCNSGIFLRISKPGDGGIGRGFEVQVLDSYGKKPGKEECGALYLLAAPTKNMVKAPGEWNHCEVICKGPQVTVSLNGEQIIDANLDQWTEPKKNPDGTTHKFNWAFKDSPREGYIGLSDHGHNCWYKNLKVRPLK